MKIATSKLEIYNDIEHKYLARTIPLHPLTPPSSCSLGNTDSDGGTGMNPPAPIHQIKKPYQL
jgi:hypothetical protein